MKKNLIVIAVVTVGLFACKSEEKPKEAAKEGIKTEQDQQANVDADRVLNVELEGMVCKMGCGGAIRKELNATGAVANCEFDFEEDRKVDVAKIKFDKDKITADEIVKIVSEINDGQFTVGKVSSEDLSEVNVIEDESSTRVSEETKVKVKVKSGDLPSLFDLFSIVSL